VEREFVPFKVQVVCRNNQGQKKQDKAQVQRNSRNPRRYYSRLNKNTSEVPHNNIMFETRDPGIFRIFIAQYANSTSISFAAVLLLNIEKAVCAKVMT
jgi:hypothetical protein